MSWQRRVDSKDYKDKKMAVNKRYNSLKLKLSRWVLANNLKKAQRVIQICSLQNASTIGVTFVAKSPTHLKDVNKFIKELNTRGIKISALGYIPEKKPNDFFLSDKTINFFYDKELDWLYRSKNEEAIRFQNTEFDILIDIDGYEYFPMQLLLNSSKARFKVGRFCENSPFDLMIDVKKSSDIKFYFEQITHYLLKFN